ncbi:Mu transposase domain-containing protein [Actinomadura coerulea]|uniref:Mu transposase domain-containing protein n=1 Tax=Actinomadura coerulea TaxID=46159 RepID=UPI003F4E2275
MDAAFAEWVPLRRAKVHSTHGEVIRMRAVRDHTAATLLPSTTYVVVQRHLRYVGKDCLVAFDANLYSVPALRVQPRQLVEVPLAGRPGTRRRPPGSTSRPYPGYVSERLIDHAWCCYRNRGWFREGGCTGGAARAGM